MFNLKKMFCKRTHMPQTAQERLNSNNLRQLAVFFCSRNFMPIPSNTVPKKALAEGLSNLSEKRKSDAGQCN